MGPDGVVLSRFSQADYEAAIRAAPPGTMIKLGDLDKMADEQVQCSTCQMIMPKSASPYHVHPKACGVCGDTFDENLERHEPIHREEPRGAGTVKWTTGCKKVTL